MIRSSLKGITGDDVRAGSIGVITGEEKGVELLYSCNAHLDVDSADQQELELKRLVSCTRDDALRLALFLPSWTSVRLTQQNPSLGALRLLNASRAAMLRQRDEARVIG